MNLQPEIIFEDNSIIVCYKPAGFATQTKNVAEQDMVSFLQNYRASKGENTYIGVITRLDQPVEGVLVFAKTKEAAAKLSKYLQQHIMAKKYYAVVTRAGLPESGTMVDYIVKDSVKSRAKVVNESDPRAKRAELRYKAVDQVDDRTLLDIELITGRFHQIRCQLASRTAPILGDVKYGGTRTGEPLCLASYEISFLHPDTGEQMNYVVKPRGNGFKDFNI